MIENRMVLPPYEDPPDDDEDDRLPDDLHDTLYDIGATYLPGFMTDRDQAE